MRYYVLDAAQNTLPATLHEWADFLQNGELRIVRQEEQGEVRLSTVFLGIDHRWTNYGEFDHLPPIVFETCVFGGEHDGWTWRCCTFDQAVALHNAVRRWLDKRWYKPWTWGRVCPTVDEHGDLE